MLYIACCASRIVRSPCSLMPRATLAAPALPQHCIRLPRYGCTASPAVFFVYIVAWQGSQPHLPAALPQRAPTPSSAPAQTQRWLRTASSLTPTMMAR